MRPRATLKRILDDVRHLRHIDVYVAAALAIIVAVLSVIPDVVSDNVRTAVILAALSVLVFHISIPERLEVGLDRYLNDRATFPPLSERIRSAQKLWIYAPSAANILKTENIEAIRKTILAHKDGEFRVVIQNPDATEAVNILIQQLDKSLDYQIQNLPQEIKNTLDQFKMVKSWKKEGVFDCRLLDYSPGFSLVVIDPHKSSGRVIVETHGFHNESTGSRMNIEITRSDSERWYTYWVSQFEHIWNEGKTT